MSRRGITVLGLAAAGGVGYYLYNAGGDPKVAEKQFEADASKMSAKIKSEAPGREKEAEKRGQAMAQQAGQKFDRTVEDAKARLNEAKGVAADYRDKAEKEFNRTGKEFNKAVDKFDSTVEQKSSEAKKGISSWFGGK